MQALNHIDLWAMYFKEREGFETVHSSHAIASYKISGEECYIKDIFVHPDFRKTKEAFNLAERIAEMAKEFGCKCLTGSVVPSTVGASHSMMAMLKYGFKIKESHNDFIILIKEI